MFPSSNVCSLSCTRLEIWHAPCSSVALFYGSWFVCVWCLAPFALCGSLRCSTHTHVVRSWLSCHWLRSSCAPTCTCLEGAGIFDHVVSYRSVITAFWGGALQQQHPHSLFQGRGLCLMVSVACFAGLARVANLCVWLLLLYVPDMSGHLRALAAAGTCTPR